MLPLTKPPPLLPPRSSVASEATVYLFLTTVYTEGYYTLCRLRVTHVYIQGKLWMHTATSYHRAQGWTCAAFQE